jgi:hypothetical protein
LNNDGDFQASQEPEMYKYTRLSGEGNLRVPLLYNKYRPSNLLTMTADSNKVYPAPLNKSGVLDDKFKYEDATPVIGREYPEGNIVDDILNASDSDELLRDLAITSKSA